MPYYLFAYVLVYHPTYPKLIPNPDLGYIDLKNRLVFKAFLEI